MAKRLFNPLDFNVVDFEAKGDGVTDDRNAFQACFDAAIAARGRVIVPCPSVYYNIGSTINVLPGAPNQVFVDVLAHGWGGNGTSAIRYSGADNQPVFKIVGLKQSIWTGLKIDCVPGKSGIQAFDIDTTVAAESTSFVTFKNCHVNLVGINSVGWRTGHVSGGGADISNYQWENCIVFGDGFSAGQVAYLNEGVNTLSMTWLGGFTAHCERIYSNLSQAGASSGRGNGSVFFYGMGGSGNTIDYDFNWEQAYTIIGGRYESGGAFMKTGFGSYNAAISVINVQINDYTENYCFDINTGASLVIDNCRMNQVGGTYTNLVKLASAAGYGTLDIRNGCTKATNIYQHNGGNWKVYVRGVGSASDNNNVVMGSYFADVTAQVLNDF